MIQNTGLDRDTLDKYHTNPNISRDCINTISEKLEITTNDLVIEPGAGNGSFIEGIKTLTPHYYFYDIEPEHEEVIQQDYLTFDYSFLIGKYRKIHIIGNPPFGRQGTLAKKFIKKSLEFCNTLSFILPKSFKKQSYMKMFPLQFHLIHECDLPKDSFVINETTTYDVPCVFQIWEKKNYMRMMSEILTPNNYRFVKKGEEHDISFRRVGFKAGEISVNTEDKSIQSHYFIKFDVDLSDELFDKLSSIEYPCKDNTVGPKSISKQELIKEFNIYTV
jgi:predicted RNA methylase